MFLRVYRQKGSQNDLKRKRSLKKPNGGHFCTKRSDIWKEMACKHLFKHQNKNIQKLSPQGLTFLLRSIDSASTGKGNAVGENAYKTAVLQAPTVL
ncbi:MAG: hypothetical protein GY822_19530 [Deltaproteobacteria bacterium]|nr:hypothetical protein [Deltaproteobacteria bacterium]